MDLKHKRIGDTSSNLSSEAPLAQFSSAPPLLSSPRSAPSLTDIGSQSEPKPYVKTQAAVWDPEAILANLSVLEQKLHQVQDLVHSVAYRGGGQLPHRSHDSAAQHQLIAAELTCIIIQLITAAGTLLPSMTKSTVSPLPATDAPPSHPSETCQPSDLDDLVEYLSNGGGGDGDVEDSKDSEDGADGENLPPGPYEVLQLEEEEILAPHTHFCVICGKGFKRDANLRMHMRGHGDEYKTPAALAKPTKEMTSDLTPIKRYSCPSAGCRRNKEHKKFQPLKTILCVKNHYKRSHCDKRYTCSRCHAKKFSVLADLKTHEKHCGRDKWLCSCGTTFSRKDKLFGHVALFQGHAPALPDGEKGGDSTCKLDGNPTDAGGVDDDRGLFSMMNFDSYSFGGIDEFARSGFDGSEGSFDFLASGASGFVPRNG